MMSHMIYNLYIVQPPVRNGGGEYLYFFPKTDLILKFKAVSPSAVF